VKDIMLLARSQQNILQQKHIPTMVPRTQLHTSVPSYFTHMLPSRRVSKESSPSREQAWIAVSGEAKWCTG